MVKENCLKQLIVKGGIEYMIEISLKGFCALGGLTNPKLFTETVRNRRGQYLYTRYMYIKY